MFTVINNEAALLFIDKTDMETNAYQSTSVHPGVYHRKSPWWLSKTTVHHHHHHHGKKRKKPCKILLNQIDDICRVLLLLLLRLTSVCPAAVLQIRQWKSDRVQPGHDLIPAVRIFVLNPCQENKKISLYVPLQICFGFILLWCFNQAVSGLLLNAGSGARPFMAS